MGRDVQHIITSTPLLVILEIFLPRNFLLNHFVDPSFPFSLSLSLSLSLHVTQLEVPLGPISQLAATIRVTM